MLIKHKLHAAGKHESVCNDAREGKALMGKRPMHIVHRHMVVMTSYIGGFSVQILYVHMYRGVGGISV